MLKVINVISDSNIGGAGRMLLTFLRNYDRNKIEMTVLLPSDSLLIEELEKLGVPYQTDYSLAEQSFSLSSISWLKEMFILEKPDIIHTHASMSARIAARWAGCKIVYTRHSVFPNGKLKMSFPLKQVYGAVNNYFADAVIAVSPAAKENIVEAGQNSKKVTVIYNGVDKLTVPENKTGIRAAYGLRESDFVCGIFARLTPVKGHEFILDAAKRLAGEKNIKFVIAGTGEIESALKEYAAEKNLENVIFTGFVSNVEELMGVIDVQLNASYGTEATSLALLEGMSMGLPAVVSSFGGNPFVITHEENGLVFPEKNGAALADSISRLYHDRQLCVKLGENAVRIFSERFTAEEMTRRIEALYHSL